MSMDRFKFPNGTKVTQYFGGPGGKATLEQELFRIDRDPTDGVSLLESRLANMADAHITNDAIYRVFLPDGRSYGIKFERTEIIFGALVRMEASW